MREAKSPRVRVSTEVIECDFVARGFVVDVDFRILERDCMKAVAEVEIMNPRIFDRMT